MAGYILHISKTKKQNYVALIWETANRQTNE